MRGRLVRAALAAVLLVGSSAGVVAAEPPVPDRAALLDELGRGRLAFHEETGALRFAGGTRNRPSAPRARLGGPANPRAAARAFVDRYGTLFGVADPARQLEEERRIDSANGGAAFRFRQSIGDVPVLAGELTVTVDAAGNVVSALGEATPGAPSDLAPTISAAQARQTAVALVRRGHEAGLVADLAASQPALWIYDPALLGAPGLPGARLVWRTEVRNPAGDVDVLVLVDAQTGGVALSFSQVAHARSRSVCDAANSGSHLPCTSPLLTESSGSSSDADVNSAFVAAGDFYDFFFNRFGRDSYDNAGATLVATARYCHLGNCAALNALWNGSQAAFWPGMAADDVVAHEFGHGFTQHTSGLFYYFQSGAINEALSDIFGELVDLTNAIGTDDADSRWLMGEDTVMSAIRDMSDPPAFGDPDRMGSSHYVADPTLADNGGVHGNSGVANKAAYLMVDGDTFNGQTISGIGIDKAAAVWYRVATVYLASGSDYEDLGLALNQACTDLVGSDVRDGLGAVSGAISAADCVEVAKAVTATEMSQQPTTPGAASPEAPLCTSGSPSDIYLDQISQTGAGWAKSGASNRWFVDDAYATSKPWHLYGVTPPSAGQAEVYQLAAVTVPPNAFLHFRHAHFFDTDFTGHYDGGVVAYQVVGSGWKDAQSLFTHNGYNGSIRSYTGGNNPLAGRAAFVGYTGYISSRLNLSSLAGKSVRFRFRTGTDIQIGDMGWFIDDVRLYTCTSGGGGGGDSTPPAVTPPNADLRSGLAATGTKPVKLSVGFSASDAAGTVTKTELQRRANTNAYTNVALSGATATSVNLAYKPHATTTRQLRARATDNAANTSDWATADPFRILVHQNGSAALTQSGSWSNGSKSSFWGGSVRFSSSAGARIARTGVVSDFAVVSTLGPGRGRADILVDGVLVQTIDLYSATARFRQVIFAVDFGAPGNHTIEVRVNGTKNAKSKGTRVDLDAIIELTP